MALPNDTATRVARALSADQKAFVDNKTPGVYSLGRASDVIRSVMLEDIAAGTLTPSPAKEKAKAAAKAAKPASSRWRGAVTDAEWLDELEKEEVLRHIDVRRELGKCQLWGKGRGEIITRQRFVNWLVKAQPTVGYDARGKSSNDAKTPKPQQSPRGWLKALRAIFPDAVYFHENGPFEIKDESDSEWAKIPDSARRLVEKELAR